MFPRKLLKFLGYTVSGLVAVIALAFAAVYLVSHSRLKRHHLVQPRAITVPADAEAIARGKHLAAVRGCGDCHGADFAGNQVVEDPLIGTLHGPNLTRGEGGLPADFSDADYVRAIRHGVARDGRALVLMPSKEFAPLTDADLGDLIAYLKSIPPVNKPRVPVKVGPLARALILAGEIELAAEHIDHETAGLEVVPRGPTAEYGKYLAAACTGCHGSNLSGGKIAGAPPDWPASANLTPHPTGATVGWSEADFINTLRTHRRPDGTELHPLMPAVYAQMTDEELQAVWRFLRSLPAAEKGQRKS